MSGQTGGKAEGISAPFIRFPIGTSLLMAGILFVGLVAYPLLPVAPLPQVDFPTIQVTATLPGASPETMATSVAQPLERQFAQIPGIAQMTSTSYLGTTSITIQFDLNRNIDGAANDVQGGINAAAGQLPKNLPSPPTYRKVKVSQSIDGRSVVDEGLSPGQQVITSGQYKVQPGTLVTTAVASSDPAQSKVKQE